MVRSLQGRGRCRGSRFLCCVLSWFPGGATLAGSHFWSPGSIVALQGLALNQESISPGGNCNPQRKERQFLHTAALECLLWDGFLPVFHNLLSHLSPLLTESCSANKIVSM